MPSKSARIITLLIIDSAFFFLELIVGYAVGSLALVADSFHMLNDVCSLIVALYALKLAQRQHTTEQYTYGWQRAEVLGALVNGVFLLALCFSIFMEAIERFFKATEVGSPKLVVIVGSLGLASNIVGLFLFHDHGHSHGGHSHSHSHAHSHSHDESAAEQGRITSPPAADPAPTKSKTDIPYTVEDDAQSEDSAMLSEDEDIVSVHPAQTRANVVRAAQRAGYGSTQRTVRFDAGHERRRSDGDADSTSNLRRSRSSSAPAQPGKLVDIDEDDSHSHPAGHDHDHAHSHDEGDGHAHHGHDEEAHKSGHSHSHGGGGGHSHGNMNMRGVFLHVLGDALGNMGVIASGLFIWLTTYTWRFYSDPLISLIITVIIFSSALPLVKSASFVLLQGTPRHVPLDEVRNAIMRVEGVLDVHELHVWSLSESKLIGSVHVLLTSQKQIPEISAEIRRILHRFGIHSSTIQPEVVSLANGGGPGTPNIAEIDLTGASCPVACVEQCE